MEGEQRGAKLQGEISFNSKGEDGKFSGTGNTTGLFLHGAKKTGKANSLGYFFNECL